MIKHIIKRKLFRNESGVILVGIITITAALLIVGIAVLSLTTSEYTLTNRSVFRANATLLAETGVEYSLHELNLADTFAGFAGEQELFNNQTQGRGVYETAIEHDPETNARIIRSTGRVYKYQDPSGDAVSQSSVKVTIVGTDSDGYSVHTGPGGLILGGSANITNSDVYVNGTISLTGAAKIGTNSQPVDVNVAHHSCPTGSNPGPTYPVLCTAGQPISMAWSTAVYGSVCATNQTSTGPNPSGNIKTGVDGEGLIIGCTAPPVSPPSYDKSAHVGNVAITTTGNDNSYVCNNWPFDRVWPANLKLTGNVTIASSCNLRVMGDVYITGNLTLGGAARITVDDSVSEDNRPVILVDGSITAGGSAQVIANSDGTGMHFISYKANAACNPDCVSLSGNELKNSQNQETVTIGGGGNLSGMIFHAQWGRLRLAGSGTVGAAIGQTVDMNGAGTVTFGTALSSGERTWTITSYQRDFIN